MSLRAAITRAAPENERTAARVRALGAEPVLAPLLTIERRDFDASLAGIQALLFTSINGVRAFAGETMARTLPVMAVGDATAQAAREAGFTDIHSANGDVAALSALAKQTFDPAQGALLHISGADVAGDLIAALDAAGFDAERRIGYAARPVTALPPAFRGPLDIVLFHSPRAARIFVRLGAPNAEALVAGCLSPAVAASAAGPAWKQLIVAPAPREDALLEATFRR